MFNFGLHFATPGSNGTPANQSLLVQGLLGLAKWRLKHAAELPRLVWMDTPAQHFSTPDGSWPAPGKPPFTCRPLKAWHNGDRTATAGGPFNAPIVPLVTQLADAHLRVYNASVPLWQQHWPARSSHCFLQHVAPRKRAKEQRGSGVNETAGRAQILEDLRRDYGSLPQPPSRPSVQLTTACLDPAMPTYKCPGTENRGTEPVHTTTPTARQPTQTSPGGSAGTRGSPTATSGGSQSQAGGGGYDLNYFIAAMQQQEALRQQALQQQAHQQWVAQQEHAARQAQANQLALQRRDEEERQRQQQQLVRQEADRALQLQQQQQQAERRQLEVQRTHDLKVRRLLDEQKAQEERSRQAAEKNRQGQELLKEAAARAEREVKQARETAALREAELVKQRELAAAVVQKQQEESRKQQSVAVEAAAQKAKVEAQLEAQRQMAAADKARQERAAREAAEREARKVQQDRDDAAKRSAERQQAAAAHAELLQKMEVLQLRANQEERTRLEAEEQLAQARHEGEVAAARLRQLWPPRGKLSSDSRRAPVLLLAVVIRPGRASLRVVLGVGLRAQLCPVKQDRMIPCIAIVYAYPTDACTPHMMLSFAR